MLRLWIIRSASGDYVRSPEGEPLYFTSRADAHLAAPPGGTIAPGPDHWKGKNGEKNDAQ